MEVPTGFTEVEAHGFYIITRPAYYKLAVSLAERDPERVLSDSARRPEPDRASAGGNGGGMRGRGAHVELPGEGGETLILKKNRRGGLYGRFVGDLHKNDYQAVAEVMLSETAWKKGVPVALLAFAMSAPAAPTGRRAAYRRGYSASIRVPGARSLMEWLESPISSNERRAVLEATAHAVARAHDRGFQHGDLNLGNILVVRSEQREYSAWFVDLAHSTLGGTLRVKPRVENLVRLYRSAEKWLPGIGQRNLVRFMRAYTRGDRVETRRYFEAAARHRTSLFLHRLGWRIGGKRRQADVRPPSAPAGR